MDTQARQRFAGCWLVRSRPWKEKGGTHRERSLLASCLAWLLSSNPYNLQAIQPVWLKFPDKGQSTFIHHPAPKFCHYNPISSGLEGLPREGRHQQKSWGRRMRWDWSVFQEVVHLKILGNIRRYYDHKDEALLGNIRRYYDHKDEAL